MYKSGIDLRICEPLIESLHSHVCCQLLKHYLDKDSTGGGGLILVEMDTREGSPGEGVRIEEVRKEFGSVSKFVCLQSVHCSILCVCVCVGGGGGLTTVGYKI